MKNSLLVHKHLIIRAEAIRPPTDEKKLTERFKEFIESMEGPLGLIECLINDECNQLSVCNIKKPIKKINDNLLNFLDNISLIEITK